MLIVERKFLEKLICEEYRINKGVLALDRLPVVKL